MADLDAKGVNNTVNRIKKLKHIDKVGPNKLLTAAIDNDPRALRKIGFSVGRRQRFMNMSSKGKELNDFGKKVNKKELGTLLNKL